MSWDNNFTEVPSETIDDKPSNSWESKKDSGGTNWSTGNSGGGGGSKPEVKNPYVARLPLYVAYLPDNRSSESDHNKALAMLKFLATKGFVIRYGLNDANVHKMMQDNFEPAQLEATKPWQKFKLRDDPSFESKVGCSPRSRALMELIFPHFFNKIPDKVKPFTELMSVVILGSFLNQSAQLLITNTPDGVTDAKEATKETGSMRTAIDLANKMIITVVNLSSGSCDNDFNIFVGKL